MQCFARGTRFARTSRQKQRRRTVRRQAVPSQAARNRTPVAPSGTSPTAGEVRMIKERTKGTAHKAESDKVGQIEVTVRGGPIASTKLWKGRVMPSEEVRPEPQLSFHADGVPLRGALRIACGADVFIDRVDLTRQTSRERFVARAVAQFRALDRQQLLQTLDRLAADQWQEADQQPPTRQPVEWQPSAAVKAKAAELLKRPSVLEEIVDTAGELGIAGERSLISLLYLCITSRLLPRGLYLLIEGAPGSGKSHIARTVVKQFVPPQVAVNLTDVSPMALYYLERDIAHHVVLLGERRRQKDESGTDATKAIRELVEDGEITKAIPVRRPDGRMITQEFRVRGPVSLIETCSHGFVADEDLSRMVRVWTDESALQNKRVNRANAEARAHPAARASPERIEIVRAVQLLLDPARVCIPFALEAAEVFPSNKTESRRAFDRLLDLTCASAVLHQRQRQRKGEYILAEPDDLRLAERLLRPWLATTLTGDVPPAVQATWQVVREYSGEFTAADVLAWRKEPISAAGRRKINRHLRELTDVGAVEVVASGQGLPARYRVVNPDWTPGAIIFPFERLMS